MAKTSAKKHGKPVAAVAATPTPKTGKAKPAPKARPIIYPQRSVVAYADDEQCGPVTGDMVKGWLGWEVVKGDHYDFICPNGDKVICHNNRAGEFGEYPNRPFNPAGCMMLTLDHLNRVFAPDGPNLETCVIGERGSTLSTQHRFISLEWANQYLRGEVKAKFLGVEPGYKHWLKKWPEGKVTMQTLVAFGARETPANIRTYDNTRGRTTVDVFYTEGWFRTHTDSNRERLGRSLSVAASTLKERAVRDLDAHNPKHTIQAAIAFARNHERLVKCVEYIFTENGGRAGKRIDSLIGSGTASALMYLMASSGSDGDAYRDRMHQGEEPCEDGLDWTRWDKAEEFWLELGTEVADDSKRPAIQQAVRAALVLLANECPLDLKARIAVIVNAWLNYVENQPCEAKDLLPSYTLNVDDPLDKHRVYHDNPECGGIDCGWAGTAGDDKEEKDEPTEEEAKAIAASIEAEVAKKNGKLAKEEKADSKSLKTAESELAGVRELFPDSKIIFVGLHSVWCYGDDADQAGKLLRKPVQRAAKREPICCWHRKDLEENVEKLRKAGQTVQLVERVGSIWTPMNGKSAAQADTAEPATDEDDGDYKPIAPLTGRTKVAAAPASKANGKKKAAGKPPAKTPKKAKAAPTA